MGDSKWTHAFKQDQGGAAAPKTLAVLARAQHEITSRGKRRCITGHHGDLR